MSVVNGSLAAFRDGRRGFFGDNKQINSSNIAAGTYGSGTQVAQVVVDGSGDITSITNVPISGAAPGGAAGGALSGTYPNPQLATQTQALNMGAHAINGLAPASVGTDAINLNNLNAISQNVRVWTATGIAAGAVTWDLGAVFSPLSMSAAGTLSINNNAGTVALKYMMNFQMLGNSPGNSWTFSAVDGGGGKYATVSPQVNGSNNTSAMNWFVLALPGVTTTVAITITLSAGVFTPTTTSPAGSASPNTLQIMQVW